MGINSKINSSLKILREDLINSIVSLIKFRYRLPGIHTKKSKWKSGINSEIQYWDTWFQTKGHKWANDYLNRLNPDLPLQKNIASYLNHLEEIHILDIGAGPLTILGKVLNGKQINITAVDPLAEEYDEILSKYNIEPLVRTEKLDAEELTKQFSANTFDLIYARNSIDHAYNPEKAILQMIDILKNGSYIILEHRENEAIKEKYSGLHQWNFSSSEEGDFLISSQFKTTNVTRKYQNLAAIKCKLLDEEKKFRWLVTTIQKK